MSTHPSPTDITTHGGANLPDTFTDPGHAPHKLRRTDTDPAANKRAERQVVLLFVASIVGTLLFLVAYVLVPPGETALLEQLLHRWQREPVVSWRRLKPLPTLRAGPVPAAAGALVVQAEHARARRSFVRRARLPLHVLDDIEITRD